MAQLSYSPAFHALVDYTDPISEADFTFKGALPKEKFSFATLYLVFDKATWIFVILSCVSIGSVLTMNDIFIFKSWSPKAASHNVIISFMTLIHVSLPNNWFNEANQSKSIIYVVWVLLSTLLGMAYENNLLSMLTIKR